MLISEIECNQMSNQIVSEQRAKVASHKSIMQCQPFDSEAFTVQQTSYSKMHVV